MWEQLLFNILSIVVGVFLGTWLGTELMSRRISKTASKILRKILDDGETRKALQNVAKEFVSYIIRTAKEQLYGEEESEMEETAIKLPKPSSFKERKKRG